MLSFSKYGCLFILYLLLSIQNLKAQDSSYVDVEDSVSTTEEGKPSLLDSTNIPPQISLRTVPDSALTRLKQDDEFWYVNTTPKHQVPKQVKEGPRSFIFSKWFGTLLWIVIIVCFVAALIWFLSSGNIQLFAKKRSKATSEGNTELSEDIFAIDYTKELEAALGAKNFELAIRLYYLQLLYLLSEKGLIQYTHEKTNSDFVHQLFTTDYYKDFARLTRHFEFTCYGHFRISGEDFTIVQREFQQFKQRINY